MLKVKSNKIYGLLAILALVIFLGSSYAFINFTLTGTKTYSIVGGELKLVLDDTDNNLVLGDTEALPIPDYQGLEQDGYNFTLKNQGKADMNYYVYIDNNQEENLMADEAIKYALTKTGDSKNTIGLVSDLENRLLTNGRINKDKEISYNLKFWIDVNATNEQVVGKVFSVKLRVVGEQIVDLAYRDSSGASRPVLAGELIAVKIDDNGRARKANINESWYDYDQSIWANAVIVNSESYNEYNNAIAGTIIEENDIESYFVWIPRYEYKIFDEQAGNYTSFTDKGSKKQEIEIKFVDKTTPVQNGSTYGTWLTHPAFTAFDTNGIWVGKFESGYKGATTTAEAQKNVNDKTKLVIKPNVYSWRNIQVANAYQTSYNYQRDLDSHMMKNTEWGAVAYLSHSKYGAKDAEGNVGVSLRTNNNKAYITGYSSTTEPTVGENGGTSIPENTNESTALGVDGQYTINYLNTDSVLSSTTGNYSGIYDMAGGAWDYMMAVVVDANGKPLSGRNNVYNSGFKGTYGCPTCDSTTSGVDSSILEDTSGIDFPTDTRYFDTYANASVWNKYNTRILGDATGEMGPFYQEVDPDNSTRNKSYWYGDFANFAYPSYPWFIRGGYWRYGSASGAFAFNNVSGRAGSNYGFRVVLAP